MLLNLTTRPSNIGTAFSFQGWRWRWPGSRLKPTVFGMLRKKGPMIQWHKSQANAGRNCRTPRDFGDQISKHDFKKTLGYSAGFMTLWGWDYLILIPNFLRNPSSMNKDYSWTFLFSLRSGQLGYFSGICGFWFCDRASWASHLLSWCNHAEVEHDIMCIYIYVPSGYLT